MTGWTVTGRVVTPDGVLAPGTVTVAGDRIVAVEPAGGPAGGPTIVPGFVDMHVHGGGGYTFTTADPDAAAGAAAFHLRHGTTTLLASLVSSPAELMLAAVRRFAPLVDAGVLAGLHFEGPYLSHARCGAQNPRHLRAPARDELTTLLDAGGARVRMMTIAPELPGALDAIALLAERGTVAAIGHTDAGYEQVLAAVAAGARVGTHLFNGMPPAHHRQPGPVFALLGAEQVVCELVADGTHLHDGTLAFSVYAAGADRLALITDAIEAAGQPDGSYHLGGQPVTVRDGVARLDPGGAIAGSTLTMDAALRRTVAAGIPLADAVRMAATTPARAIGAHDVGALRPGLRADLVLLDEELRVQRVLRAGAWC